MSFGEGNLRERVDELESLVKDLWRDYLWAAGDIEETDYTKSRLRERMAALGLGTEGDA